MAARRAGSTSNSTSSLTSPAKGPETQRPVDKGTRNPPPPAIMSRIVSSLGRAPARPARPYRMRGGRA